MPSYARAVDDNQAERAADFRSLGWQVWTTHQHAAYTPGWWDLTCLRRGRWLCVEVKVPGQQRALTAAEEAMRELVKWHGGEYHVVSTTEDVLRVSEGSSNEQGGKR